MPRVLGELKDALEDIAAHPERGAFLEVHLDPYDAPKGLQPFGPLTADFDFGPRGIFASGADIAQLRERRREDALRGINSGIFHRRDDGGGK